MLVTVLRGLLGLVFILGVAFLVSNNRRAISWRTVGAGLGLQLVFAVLILKGDEMGAYFAPLGWPRAFFSWISSFFVLILDFTQEGTAFVASPLTPVAGRTPVLVLGQQFEAGGRLEGLGGRADVDRDRRLADPARDVEDARLLAADRLQPDFRGLAADRADAGPQSEGDPRVDRPRPRHARPAVRPDFRQRRKLLPQCRRLLPERKIRAHDLAALVENFGIITVARRRCPLPELLGARARDALARLLAPHTGWPPGL